MSSGPHRPGHQWHGRSHRRAPAVQADDLLVQARAIPAHPGVNTVELRVAETRRPSPGAITSIDVAVDGKRMVAVPNDAGVAYVEGVVLPGGDTTIDAVVHRAGWSDAGASLIVTAEPAAYVHPAFVTSARISTWLLVLAAALSVVGLGLLLRASRRRAANLRGDIVAADDLAVSGGEVFGVDVSQTEPAVLGGAVEFESAVFAAESVEP